MGEATRRYHHADRTATSYDIGRKRMRATINTANFFVKISREMKVSIYSTKVVGFNMMCQEKLTQLTSRAPFASQLIISMIAPGIE